MSYGIPADVSTLDEDLKQLRASKFSPEAVEDIGRWIFEAVLKQKYDSSQSLLEQLKDGTVLCQLANTLHRADVDADVVKWKKSAMPFVQMEQIAQFLAFARQYGVPEDELFQTVDLYECQDSASVYQTLKSVSRYANKRHPDLFPVLGPQIADKRPPVKPKPQHLQRNAAHWSTHEYGSMKGASQSSEGVVFGNRRDVL